jgi:hypothetical protein
MHHLSKLKIIEGLKLLLAFLLFYFCISPSLLDLSGNMYDSSYFNLNSSYSVKIFVLTSNLIFAFILFFIIQDQFKKLIRKKDFWQMNDWAISLPFKIVLFFFAVYFLINNVANFDIERSLIKESFGIKETIIISVLFSLLSFWVLVERNYLLFFGLVFIILTLAVALFEREIILYALIPVALRIRQFVSNKVFLIGILIGLLGMISFKYVVLDFKAESTSSVELLKEREVFTELSKDASSKYGIEIDYFKGESSIGYNNLTYLGPYQFFRIFDGSRKTNGQIATKFYTNDYMGTGFSAVLESWLNFGLIGFFIAPFFISLLLLVTIRIGGPIILLASIVFFTKLLRGEFWVAYTLYMLFPFIFILLGNFFFKKI